MALRRLLSVAAAARLPGNCVPSSLASAEELGSANLRWPLQPAWLIFAARLAQWQPMHTSAPAMHAADASQPAPAATMAPHEHPGGAAELHAAGSDAQSNPLGWAPPPSGAIEGESSHEQGPPTRSITRAELRRLRKEAAGEAESSLEGGSETESARMAGPSATSPTRAASHRHTDVSGGAESSSTGRLPLPSETSAPGQGGLWAGSSRKRPPRGTAPPEPQPPNPKHPFGGTRRSPPPAPSVGGIQAEALVGALGPPQFERIGKVTAGYSVERTPQFAIVELGAAQYKVSPDDLVISEKLKGVDVNDRLALGRVLMLGSRSETIIGRPHIPGASVTAVVEEQFQDAKVTVFKKRRRKNSRRKMGHRQELTSLRIVSVHGFEAPEAETIPAIAAAA